MTDNTPQGLAARGIRVKVLDLSNLLKHAFICGRISAGASSSFHSEAWSEYDPTESAAYARILAALDATPEALADHPAVRALVEAERERIIASLKEEADLCPCAEDAVVIRDCACLIKANFSYDDAEAIRQGDTP